MESKEMGNAQVETQMQKSVDQGFNTSENQASLNTTESSCMLWTYFWLQSISSFWCDYYSESKWYLWWKQLHVSEHLQYRGY